MSPTARIRDETKLRWGHLSLHLVSTIRLEITIKKMTKVILASEAKATFYKKYEVTAEIDEVAVIIQEVTEDSKYGTEIKTIGLSTRQMEMLIKEYNLARVGR